MRKRWSKYKLKYRPAIFIAILVLPVILFFIPVDWLNQQHTVCLIKNISGYECFGCGITRAVLSVLHLDFEGAFCYNKLVVIVFPLLAYVWARTLIKMWKEKTINT